MPAFQGDYADPNDLLIVGLDELPKSIVEACKDLEDPCRVDPAKVRKDLVASILRWGVKTPVTVRTFNLSKRVRVVKNGRQRVMATRIANEKADPLIKVPYVVTPDVQEDAGVRVANTGTRLPTIREKGKDILTLIARGHDLKDIATMFSNANGEPVSVQTVRNWRDLAEGKTSKVGGEKETGGPSAPGRKLLKRLAALYEPTDSEPLEGDDVLIAAMLGWLVTGDTHGLPADLKRQIKKASKPEEM
jgi:hypothetical protein